MRYVASLIRFGEIGLKGKNRPQFESALRRNVRAALRPFPGATLHRMRGRLLALHPEEGARAVQALRCVCGVKSVSPALEATADLASIRRACSELARRRPSLSSTFCVRVRRADKTFPLRSLELEQELGRALLEEHPELRVDLEQPQLRIGVEIRPEGTFVFGERLPGPGGLPVGSTGRVLALLSGGIDSPVACYLAMKRGLETRMVFFHSAEFTGEGPAEKVKRLARRLARYQPRTTLFVVPFAGAQAAILERADEANRTLLYRRLMHRIAERLASAHGLQALVTGDALGQVASQTLENLQVTASAVAMPVLRPLLTYDKDETVELAREIGTFETSILPEPDCCTLFQPARPRIRGRLREVEENEARLDVDRLVNEALAGTERFHFDPQGELYLPAAGEG